VGLLAGLWIVFVPSWYVLLDPARHGPQTAWVISAAHMVPVAGLAPDLPWRKMSAAGDGLLAVVGLVQQLVAVLLLALVAIGFAGVLRPKPPKA